MRSTRLIAIVMLLADLLAVPAARGSSPDLVISQVFAGGGNSGASYANDYVELFNHSSSSVDLSSWSVQYATATGTTWTATPLAGTLAAGRRYLVQFASGGTTGLALPTPDATDTTSLSASGGKVSLVHATAPLTCGVTAGSCSAAATVRDLVGYGTATDYESAAAPALTNTTAATRAGAGCSDTDANASDFTAETPAPHNTAAAATTCAGGSGGGASFSQSAGIVVNVQSSISLSLERTTVSFGTVTTGDRPAAVSERVTVTSNDTVGYLLTVHRTAFAPADLPLGVATTAPAGTQLSAQFASGTLAALPFTSDLLLGTSSARSATSGDAWSTSLAFTAPLPAVAPGQYSATIVYTVIGGTIN
ncbi:MAG TPA: lamin tail domain-containing protein [Gaiellaceae bacterium]